MVLHIHTIVCWVATSQERDGTRVRSVPVIAQCVTERAMTDRGQNVCVTWEYDCHNLCPHSTIFIWWVNTAPALTWSVTEHMLWPCFSILTLFYNGCLRREKKLLLKYFKLLISGSFLQFSNKISLICKHK